MFIFLKQVLESICRSISKASFIFIFKENQQKYWYFLLMSTDHLVHIHTCCIIPTVQILSPSLASLYHVLPLTNILTLILIPFPLQNPLYPACLFLVISSILPKNSWISSINWSIKLLPLNSFSYSSEETNFKISELVEVLRKGKKQNKTHPTLLNSTQQCLRTRQGSQVKPQILARPSSNFMPDYYINYLPVAHVIVKSSCVGYDS